MGWGSKPVAARKASTKHKARAAARSEHKELVEKVKRHRRTKKEMQEFKAQLEALRAANGGRLKRGTKQALVRAAIEPNSRVLHDEDAGMVREFGRDEDKVSRILRDADKVFEKSLTDEPTDKKAIKAMFGWGELKAKKGYTDATMILLFEDYLTKRKLHEDFVKFVGKR